MYVSIVTEPARALLVRAGGGRGYPDRVIHTVAVENYRSLRRLVIALDRLTVVTGANGSGKSSLYRALRLLADAAGNGVIAALAREGGLSSTLWAGPEQPSRSMRQGVHPVQSATRRHAVGL